MENVIEPPSRQSSERSASFSRPEPSRADRKTGFRGWIGPVALLAVLIILGFSLSAWKAHATKKANAAAASQPEPVETIMVATAETRTHRRSTTSIGTVVATRSITLRNELPGTIKEVKL